MTTAFYEASDDVLDEYAAALPGVLRFVTPATPFCLTKHTTQHAVSS